MSIDADMALIAEDIPSDRMFGGAGTRRAGGTIHISNTRYLHNIDNDFVDAYKQVAEHDVVARLFYHCPDLVQRVAVADYAKLKVYANDPDAGGHRDGEKIAQYLIGAGVRHIMIAGLESKMGLAWLTFYRDSDQPFSETEGDKARFLVPAALFRWQATLPSMPTAVPLTPSSIGLLPMSVLEVDVMVRKANGVSDKDIARDFGFDKVDIVEKMLRAIRKRLGPNIKRLTHEAIRNFR